MIVAKSNEIFSAVKNYIFNFFKNLFLFFSMLLIATNVCGGKLHPKLAQIFLNKNTTAKATVICGWFVTTTNFHPLITIFLVVPLFLHLSSQIATRKSAPSLHFFSFSGNVMNFCCFKFVHVTFGRLLSTINLSF